MGIFNMNMRKYECTLVHYSCDRVMYGIHMFSICRTRSTLSLEGSLKEGRMQRGREKGVWGEVRHL